MDAGVPFHLKQWGEYGSELVKIGKKQAGRELHGREWDGLPLLARKMRFPNKPTSRKRRLAISKPANCPGDRSQVGSYLHLDRNIRCDTLIL